MTELQIELAAGAEGVEPGASLSGSASWRRGEAPKRAEVALLWYTQGRGTMDSCVVARQEFTMPQAQDQRAFTFQLPSAPYSFSGKLISLVWAVEVTLDDDEVERREFVMAPGRREILLPEVGAA